MEVVEKIIIYHSEEKLTRGKTSMKTNERKQKRGEYKKV